MSNMIRQLMGTVAAAGALCACPALAQDGEWFQGTTRGFGGLSADTGVFEGAISKFGLSLFGGRVEEPVVEKRYGGYRFTDLFALEGAQTNLLLPASACGYDSVFTDLSQPCQGASWSLSGVATLPLQGGEGVSFYGRLGFHYWQNNGHPDSSPSRAANQDVGSTYGLGVSYQFRKDWFVHAETERYSDLSQGLGLRSSSGLGLDSSVHTIGLSVRF